MKSLSYLALDAKKNTSYFMWEDLLTTEQVALLSFKMWLDILASQHMLYLIETQNTSVTSSNIYRNSLDYVYLQLYLTILEFMVK